MYDVVIVGGSAAGLSAALVLGRFRRRVLMCDSQRPRNAVATEAHGFLTRDGTPPAEILRIGREQLRPYESVELRTTEITTIQKSANGFELTTSDGNRIEAQRVLLATGIRDELPAIPGLSDYWGKGVQLCPYCHGWEVRDQPIVIIGNAETVYHLGLLLNVVSSQVTVCISERDALPDVHHATLRERGVRVVQESIKGIEGNQDGVTGVRLVTDELIPCHAIFVRSIQHQHSPLAHQIGCDIDVNGRVVIDMLGRTSVKGIYAAGDMADPLHQILHAAASGAKAAAGMNTDMVFGT